MPVPARNVGPAPPVRRVVDAFEDAERFVAMSRFEAAPTMTVGINTSGERFDRITEAFETIGGGVKRAGFALHPTNDDLSAPVAEAGDAARKVRGESFFAR